MQNIHLPLMGNIPAVPGPMPAESIGSEYGWAISRAQAASFYYQSIPPTISSSLDDATTVVVRHVPYKVGAIHAPAALFQRGGSQWFLNYVIEWASPYLNIAFLVVELMIKDFAKLKIPHKTLQGDKLCTFMKQKTLSSTHKES